MNGANFAKTQDTRGGGVVSLEAHMASCAVLGNSGSYGQGSETLLNQTGVFVGMGGSCTTDLSATQGLREHSWAGCAEEIDLRCIDAASLGQKSQGK